jgi:hypothetical protein
MEHFAGLDVSVKETSVCILDDAGKIVKEVKVASEPQALLKALGNPTYHFKRTSYGRQYRLAQSRIDPAPTSPLWYPGHAHALIDALAHGEEGWTIAWYEVAIAADGKARKERETRLCSGSRFI